MSPITALWVDEGRDASGFGRVADPSAEAAAEFARALERAGIRVLGRPARERAERGAPVLARVAGAPLAQVAEQVLSVSDNEGAEVLARHVGLAVSGRAPSAAGTDAVVSTLRRLGVRTAGAEVYDGSGLSRKNRIDPDTLVDVLRLAASEDHPDLRSTVTGLPVAGFTGSLALRFSETPGRAWPGPGQDRDPDRGQRARRRGHRPGRRTRWCSRWSRTGSGSATLSTRRRPWTTWRQPSAPATAPPEATPSGGCPRRVTHENHPTEPLAALALPRGPRMSAQMVDWDLAVTIGSRVAGEGPRSPREVADQVVAELRDDADRRPAWSASSPAWTPTSAPRRSSSSTGRAGSRPTPTASRPCSARSSTSSPRRRERRPGCRLAVGSRVTGAEVGLLLGFLASKVLGQFDPFHDAGGTAAARGSQHRARRAGARLRPHRLPALGLPARGDPPGAVHRRPVDARPPLLRDRPPSPTTDASPAELLDDALGRIVRGGPRRGRQPDRRASARPSRRRSWTGSPG